MKDAEAYLTAPNACTTVSANNEAIALKERVYGAISWVIIADVAI